MAIQKSQGAMEFILLFTILLTFGFGIFVVNTDFQVSIKGEENEINANRVLDTIENEVSIALKIGDGYERSFVLLPPTKDPQFYKLSSVGDGNIKIEWETKSLIRKMPTKDITDGSTDKFSIQFGTVKISNEKSKIIIQSE